MCNLDKIFVVSPLYYTRIKECLEEAEKEYEDCQDSFLFKTEEKRLKDKIEYLYKLFKEVRDAAMREIPNITAIKVFRSVELLTLDSGLRGNGYKPRFYYHHKVPFQKHFVYRAENEIHGFYAYTRKPDNRTERLPCFEWLKVEMVGVLAVGEKNGDIVMIADKMIILG